MGFRTRNLDRLGNSIEVTFPTDDAGFVGRECPDRKCLGYFKVRPGTGLTGDDLPCHCPYCGHTDDSDNFLTSAQVKYAESVVLRRFTEAFERDLKQLEFNHRPRPGTFGIGISLKVTPAARVPIRHYRERKLETHVTCTNCTLNYAIFGLFAYCPDCREHNSLRVLEKNLEVITKLLALAASQEDPELRLQLVEDALENCVSAFDGFGRETCRVRAHRSSNPNSVAQISFQNIERADQRLRTLFGIEIMSSLSQPEVQAAR